MSYLIYCCNICKINTHHLLSIISTKGLYVLSDKKIEPDKPNEWKQTTQIKENNCMSSAKEHESLNVIMAVIQMVEKVVWQWWCFHQWIDLKCAYLRKNVTFLNAFNVRHCQADVVVVAVWLGVVGPADGQDVILWQRILREVIMADDSPVSKG